MITIRKNPHFDNWFQVFSFGQIVDEFTLRAEAVQMAKSIARNKKIDRINVLGKIKKIR